MILKIALHLLLLLPSCSLSDSDKTIVIDPWLIADREYICQALLNGTRIPPLFGEDNLGNVLWGLVVQTEWQISTRRQQSKYSKRIDEFAWFADIMYQLIVVPYLVAMNSGLVQKTKLLPPQSNSPAKFPIIFEAIAIEIAEGWTEFFETIKILRIDSKYVSLAQLQKLLWLIHSKTVTKALPEFEHELQMLNIKERKFANGFGHFVQIPAIINLNSSYDTIFTLNQLFPPRILRLSDTPYFILDMTPQQNVIVSAFFAIDDMTKVPFIWKTFLTILRLLFSSSNL